MSALLAVFVMSAVVDGLFSLRSSERVCDRGCVSALRIAEKGVYILSLQVYCGLAKIRQPPAWRIQC